MAQTSNLGRSVESSPTNGRFVQHDVVGDTPWSLPPLPKHRDESPVPARRLQSTLMLPWTVGLVLLLALSGTSVLLVGPSPAEARVDSSVLAMQEAVVGSAAQSVRRSVNEAALDLETAVALLELAPETPLDAVLGSLLGANKRWRSIAVIDPDTRRVLAAAGGVGAEQYLGDRPPGETVVAARTDITPPAVVVSTPLQRPGEPAYVVVADIRQAALSRTLEEAAPGAAWIVDVSGNVVADLGGNRRPQPLPDARSQEAAAAAVAGSSGSRPSGFVADRAQIVSWAPVRGDGVAGNLDWGVVVTRDVTQFAPTAEDYRLRGLLFGAGLAGLVLVVFGWLWLGVLRPISRTVAEAQRVAYGDLSEPVATRRRDEIGLTLESLERIRLQLIRRHAARGPSDGGGTG